MGLLDFLKKERSYIFDLEPDQRRMLLASILYGVASPIFNLFTNTYLWRQSQDVVVLTVFQIVFHAGLALGFFLNGLCVKHVPFRRLFFLGCLLQGGIPVLLILLGGASVQAIIPIGLTLGLSSGIYWSSRNTFTLDITKKSNRFKYLSLESSFTLAAALITPLLIGWFLVLGDRIGWYTVQQAYLLVATIGFLLLIVAGGVILRVMHAPAIPTRLFVGRGGRHWNQERLIEYLSGLVNGFELVLPLVILLLFLQGEGSIGTVQSGATLLSILGMYLLGKRIQHKDHAKILTLWTGITGVGKTVFAVLSSVFGALFFHACNGLVISFRWASFTAILYEVIDKESQTKETERYAYITDREAFLNVGRLTGLGMFLLFYFLTPSATIRYGLLLTIPIQFVLILLVKQIAHSLPHEASLPTPQNTAH